MIYRLTLLSEYRNHLKVSVPYNLRKETRKIHFDGWRFVFLLSIQLKLLILNNGIIIISSYTLVIKIME